MDAELYAAFNDIKQAQMEMIAYMVEMEKAQTTTALVLAKVIELVERWKPPEPPRPWWASAEPAPAPIPSPPPLGGRQQ